MQLNISICKQFGEWIRVWEWSQYWEGPSTSNTWVYFVVWLSFIFQYIRVLLVSSVFYTLAFQKGKVIIVSKMSACLQAALFCIALCNCNDKCFWYWTAGVKILEYVTKDYYPKFFLASSLFWISLFLFLFCRVGQHLVTFKLIRVIESKFTTV